MANSSCQSVGQSFAAVPNINKQHHLHTSLKEQLLFLHDIIFYLSHMCLYLMELNQIQTGTYWWENSQPQHTTWGHQLVLAAETHQQWQWQFYQHCRPCCLATCHGKVLYNTLWLARQAHNSQHSSYPDSVTCHTLLNHIHDCISVNVLNGAVCSCHVQVHAIMQQTKLNLQ